jgi:hypothetical protein
MALTIDLLRPEDLLTLRIELRNLRLDTKDAKNPKLVVDKPKEAAYLIVNFPPQSITEKAYFETAANISTNPLFNTFPPPPPLPGSPDPLDAPGSVAALISGPSRLVFKLPPDITEIPYQIANLLDWSNLELVVSPLAQGKVIPPPIVAPGALETAVEIPFRLVLSPGSGAAWVNATRPVTHAGWTELWHTRLAKIRTIQTKQGKQRVLEEASPSTTMPLRAIWSPDFVDHGQLPTNVPFRSSMDPSDRDQIVILTSGTSGYFQLDRSGVATPYVPQPVQASRLFLSALGGYLSSRGSWPSPPYYNATSGQPAIVQLDLTEWVHIATQGRDHYVRIVYDGFLFPFGHRATLVKVTERKVVPPDGVVTTSPTAYMMQHMYIVVREHEKVYDTSLYTFQGREMPLWQKITFKTLVTPDIDNPQPLQGGGGGGIPNSFWINVGGSAFQFHVTAIDLADKTINLLAPMIFMSLSESSPSNVQAAYVAAGDARASAAQGQKIAYADPAAGDTILKTISLYFDTQLLKAGPPYPGAPFIPFLSQAKVSVPALEQIFGSSGPYTIQLFSGYLSTKLDANAGVYAELVSTPPGLTFSAEKAGGFATPNLAVKSISARKGAIGGKPTDAAAGQLDPLAFFDSASAQLFGAIPITSLIPVDKITKLAPSGPNATEIKTEFHPNQKNPTSIVTKVHWAPQITSYTDSSGIVSIDFNQQGFPSSALTLDASFTRDLKGGASSSNIKGALTNFLISLAGVIALQIKAITFASKKGEKTIVTAQLPDHNPIVFIGPLSFLQTLADILPPGLFGGEGPSINLTSTMIKVSYTLGLPTITAGMFSLEHIAITTGLDLPFLDGRPALEFGFASRSKPFLVTVEIFGGGGFVHLVLDTKGIQMVEGAIEFGGNFSFDVGVASGGVHAMAGIYFQLKGSFTELTGFVDIGGEVSVLGIISISIDLNLSLSWIHNPPHPDMIQGRATLTISVHILFFSVHVGVSVEKSFSVGGGDPRVIDMVTAKDWADYAAAFA